MTSTGNGGHGIRLTAVAAAILLSGCGGQTDGPVTTQESTTATTGDSETANARNPSAASEATAPSWLAADDVAYLTRLGLIRGHLRVGLDLYRTGHHGHARRHMKHPGDELYTELKDAFTARRSQGFADELETLANLVYQDAAYTAVDRAYTTLVDRIRAAESHVDSLSMPEDAERHIAVAINLLEIAALEYGAGIVAGRVENVHEYQDAYGFTQIALERVNVASAAASSDAAREQLARIATEITVLSNLWPTLVPCDRIEGNAIRITAVANDAARILTQLNETSTT